MSVINRWILKEDSNGLSPTGFGAGDAPTILRKASDLLGACAQGAHSSNFQLAYNPVAAQATITVTGTGTAADTLTVLGTTITMETSGALPASNQVNIGGSVTALAAQIVGLINGTFKTTHKTQLPASAKPLLAFDYFWRNVEADRMPPEVEVRHCGRCGRCGRKLTVPESIDRGIGPDCTNMMGG